MKKYRKFQLCMLLMVSLVLAFGCFPNSSIAEGWTVQNGDSNRNINFEIAMDVIPGYKDTSRYLVGLHSRSEAYHPKSVLISGILLAPAGTEIRNAGVDVNGQWFSALEVCRFVSQNIPEPQLEDMEVDVDRSRSAFAFLVDLTQANLQENYVVRIEVSGVTLTFSDYKITLDSNCWPYSDTLHALEGYVVKLGESNEGVRLLQQNLAANEYLNDKQISGVYDETTQQAVSEFCKVNGFSESEAEKSKQGVTQAVFMLASSSQALSKPKLGLQTILDALNKEVFTLGDFSVELWMLVAAGALLLAIVLVLVLVLTKKKKKVKSEFDEYDSAPITSDDFVPENMVEIDEPTVDLEKQFKEKKDSAGELDGETEEINYHVQPEFTITLRLFYEGMYADQSLQLKEGESALIGRSSEARIQTNPADKSVSSRHGLFSVKNEAVVYTDQSTNGTKVGESLFLGKNKETQSFNLPLNTRVTMEIGAHKVWVIVKQ